MKPSDRIQLLSALYDLPLLDKEGSYCGVVDDVRLDGWAGGKLRVAAILVGPGAYAGRLPAWAHRLVTWIAGDRVTTVAWSQVEKVGSAVQLKGTANQLGLHVAENKVRKLIPKGGAL